jgi:hypothetical protein
MDPRVGLVVRLSVEVVVFLGLLINGVWVFVIALRHHDYVAHGANYVFDRGTPTYGDAAWVLLVGPVLQVAAFTGLLALNRHRPRMVALRITSWEMLGLDVVAALALVALTSATVV